MNVAFKYLWSSRTKVHTMFCSDCKEFTHEQHDYFFSLTRCQCLKCKTDLIRIDIVEYIVRRHCYLFCFSFFLWKLCAWQVVLCLFLSVKECLLMYILLKYKLMFKTFSGFARCWRTYSNEWFKEFGLDNDCHYEGVIKM